MPSKILIADDETYIRFLIQQTFEDLEDQGTIILTAENGEKTLEIIRTEKPDLVFLDVMMPKVNGFEVCQAVKQDEALKNTFIVILTAKGQEFDRRRGEEVGADVFITKPFDPDELIALAASVLKRP
jgi:two-component system, OmpR family, alkaline phosphatase synthesis response regulator PhoP